MTEEFEEEQVNKVEQLAKRIELYRQNLMPELEYYTSQHNLYLQLIENIGINDPECDPILLGPSLLGQVQRYYSMARAEAYNVSAKCRDLQKYYLAMAEQGKSIQYERVRRGHYDKKMNNATDAKEIARRVGGRLEERAAHWEGEYMRWQGIGDSYEQMCNSVKDLCKLAEYEYKKGQTI